MPLAVAFLGILIAFGAGYLLRSWMGRTHPELPNPETVEEVPEGTEPKGLNWEIIGDRIDQTALCPAEGCNYRTTPFAMALHLKRTGHDKPGAEVLRWN